MFQSSPTKVLSAKERLIATHVTWVSIARFVTTKEVKCELVIWRKCNTGQQAYSSSPEATPPLLGPLGIVFAFLVHAILIVDSAIEAVVDHPRGLNVIADGAGGGGGLGRLRSWRRGLGLRRLRSWRRGLDLGRL